MLVSLKKRPELLNSWGATHRGVIMSMLDLVMSWAVRGHYGVAGRVLTVDLSVGIMKGSFGDNVTAEGRVLRRQIHRLLRGRGARRSGRVARQGDRHVQAALGQGEENSLIRRGCSEGRQGLTQARRAPAR